MSTKADFLNKAIENGWKVIFNYVTADMQIKYNKQVIPKEVKFIYLWGVDTLDDTKKIKRYLVDGIQALHADTGEGLLEFLEEN